MNGFRVIAVTKKGEDALRKIVHEQTSYKNRKIGGTKRLVKEKPYTIEMTPSKLILVVMNNPHIDVKAVFIIPVMNMNEGGTIDVDYEVEFI